MTTQGTQTDCCPAAAPTYAETAARSPPAASKTAQKEKDTTDWRGLRWSCSGDGGPQPTMRGDTGLPLTLQFLRSG
ncbi:hypothetical protein ACOMHN_066818 [Nucella lapillus]